MLRFFGFGLVYLSLATAAAQTPQDVAHQLWPSGPPISSSTAPTHVFAENQFLPADIAQRPALAGFVSRKAPLMNVSSAFTGSDLARLRGDQTPGPSYTSTRDLRVAEGPK